MQLKCNPIFLCVMAAMCLTFVVKGQQQAQVQMIHNSADTGLETVDIYVNGQTNGFLQDVAFRDATPILPVPAGTSVNIGLAPANSTDVNDTVANFQETFVADTHAVIVNGVRQPSQYQGNPEGSDTELALYKKSDIRTSSNQGSSYLDVSVFQGLTDAPLLDILVESDEIPQLTNLAYGEFSNYLPLETGNFYNFDVTDTANEYFFHSAFANIRSLLGGNTAIAYLSGFTDSTANNDGRKTDIMIALLDGTTIELTEVNNTFHQFVHNSPDPALDTIDLYIDGMLVEDNLKFREATDYRSLSKGSDTIKIGVAPATSNTSGNGYDDTLATFDRYIIAGFAYNHTGLGVTNPAEFAANPEGIPTLSFFKTSRGRTFGDDGNIAMDFLQGIPDAPTLDIEILPSPNNLNRIGNINYAQNESEATGEDWLIASPDAYDITLYDSTYTNDSANAEKFFEFSEDLSAYRDSALFLFTSGFFVPEDNKDGHEVQLVGVFPSGDTVLFNKTFDHNNNSVGLPNASTANFKGSIHPNPAFNSAQLSFKLERANEVAITVHNTNGQVVNKQELGKQEAGEFTREIPVDNLESGLYLVSLQAGEKQQNLKLIVK